MVQWICANYKGTTKIAACGKWSIWENNTVEYQMGPYEELCTTSATVTAGFSESVEAKIDLNSECAVAYA